MPTPVVLSGSVGANGSNLQHDVLAVQTRFIELGFTWIPQTVGPSFIATVQLFQAIKNGADVVYGTKQDGRIDPGGDTLKWLNASNAPRWMRMTAQDVGLYNSEVADTTDNHDYGTSWLDETLRAAAKTYQDAWRSWNNAALLTVNDASLPRGGDTPAHKGHETGLVCDLRLPRKDGKAGGITTASADYDRPAMRAQLQALKAQPLYEVIFLNDNELIKEGLCRPLSGHDNHVHFEIRPPLRGQALSR